MVVQYTTAYYDRDNIPRLVYCYFPEPSETVLETQMISQPLVEQMKSLDLIFFEFNEFVGSKKLSIFGFFW